MTSLAPVKNILRMISSCQTEEQINNCKLIVNNYIKTAKKLNVVNINDLQKRLDEELLERQEELYLVKILV